MNRRKAQVFRIETPSGDEIEIMVEWTESPIYHPIMGNPDRTWTQIVPILINIPGLDKIGSSLRQDEIRTAVREKLDEIYEITEEPL